MVCQKRYSMQDYPKDYVNEHFCTNCGQHYNTFHRNKGRCNDYIEHGKCSHKNFCFVKKITLPCGHNICWRCREQWTKKNPFPFGKGCIECDVGFQLDSIKRATRHKSKHVNENYVDVIYAAANNLPPPDRNMLDENHSQEDSSVATSTVTVVSSDTYNSSTEINESE